MTRFFLFALFILCLFTTVDALLLHAQAPCGEVESIQFPVDLDVYQLAQDFGTSSQRHQGRYHTGEDYHGPRGATLGDPVRAIAVGRVMYAYHIAWGRDGGVVIIEHTFPNGEIFYSVYGHLMTTDEVPLPAQLACVAAGDIIGLIGEARPAPHLHFEIKTTNPNSPGPGYTRENPESLGWLRPSKFVLNWRARLHPSFRWQLDLSDEAAPRTPPVRLDDNSLVYLDTDRVRRGTLDGRVLWRVIPEGPVAGLAAYQDSAMIVYADGTVQPVTRDGTVSPGWSLGANLTGPAITSRAGDLLLFRTPDSTLVALDGVAQGLRWGLGDVPPLRRWHDTGRVFGFITTTKELLLVSRDGQLLDRAALRSGGALGTAPNGSDLLVYTHSGLWAVDQAGVWSPYFNDALPATESASFTVAPDGRLFVFDGAILTAYDAGRTVIWQISLPEIEGLTSLDLYGSTLLLVSNFGHIYALTADSGGLCNGLQIYGTGYNEAWHHLGNDGILRVAIADQIIGFDWQRFLTACG